ncbi:MAG TPA: 4-(cytidine 5'-diphospho)-2-C-methyl-D-erythritol kinase [Acidobacteriota bacterium]|jgi:4-diphosphocytidyl-2-C-methyl-D-erythritol kinase|nr:4-(cytidine 5'-diphospho)-2-C-methyl-D-erythritol kinase [Acidobacteriota bacterium]
MFAVPSFAKINLYLRVLGQEASGYHRIETALQTISLHDTLYFERRRRPGIEVTSDRSPSGEANVVHKAAALLLPAGKGIRIHVQKQIPVGAGLGGGSSNAAVTLLVLNDVFRLKYRLPELVQAASKLGMDVPFFLVGGTACGLHYGENIVPLPDAPATSLVLLYPGVQVITARAYGNLKLTKNQADGTIQNFCYSLLNHRVDALDSSLSNDFEASVLGDRRIAEAKRFLQRRGFSNVHLSGSGSALFALGSTRKKLPVKNDWEIWQARFLTRSQYRRKLSRCLRWPED